MKVSALISLTLQHVVTRWGSTFEMFDRIYILFDPVMKTLRDINRTELCLSLIEKDVIQEVDPRTTSLSSVEPTDNNRRIQLRNKLISTNLRGLSSSAVGDRNQSMVGNNNGCAKFRRSIDLI